MGGRYFITGAQIGTIIALCSSKDYDTIEAIINQITIDQFITSSENFDLLLNKGKEFGLI